MTFPNALLSEVAFINPRRSQVERAEDKETSFVPMEAVDDITGRVTRRVSRPYSEVKKGYTMFQERDVIFAKITPCMQNGKHAVVSDLIDGIGFGSTEFHVIRAGENVLPEWIHYFLRSKEILKAAERTFTGAVGQQRVPPAFLQALKIPLPPLTEQKRITAQLKVQLAEVEKTWQTLKKQQEDFKQLQNATLEQIYQQYSSTCKEIALPEVASIEAKLVNPTLEEHRDLPHVSAENIERLTGSLLNVKSAFEDGMTSGKYLFDQGDVLYSKLRPYLRKVALPNFDGLCSADMYPLKVDRTKLMPEFLQIALLSKSFTTYANELSQRSRMPKLNRKQLFSWKMPLPHLDEQQECIKKMNKATEHLQKAQTALTASWKDVEILPSKLLEAAFYNDNVSSDYTSWQRDLWPDTKLENLSLSAMEHRQSPP